MCTRRHACRWYSPNVSIPHDKASGRTKNCKANVIAIRYLASSQAMAYAKRANVKSQQAL
jgi:hypothetical protein